MSDYDQLAQVYDLDLGDKRDDIPMYLRYAQMQQGPILELACGTGRLLLPLARQGFEVYGLDNSTAMLELAREKIAKEESSLSGKIVLVHGNMQDVSAHLRPADRKFKLAFIAFNSFLHLLTHVDQQSALSGIRDVLSDDGLLIIDIFAPHHQILGQEDDTQIYQHVRHDEPTGATYVRSDRVRRNLAEQTQEVDFIYDIIQAGGAKERIVRTVRSRFVFRYEMELTLEAAGYETVALLGGYDGQPYDYYSGIMVFVTKKSDRRPPGRFYL